jgi:hypothetical protein
MLVWVLMAWLLVPQVSRPIETKHLALQLSSGPVVAGKVPLHVDVIPHEKMHVYAPGQPGYIAITLTLDADAPVKLAGKPKYPPGEKLFMAALKETQLVYGKPFRITQEVSLRGDTGLGPFTIKGSLRYQACDDTICYRPVTVPVSWTVAGG